MVPAAANGYTLGLATPGLVLPPSGVQRTGRGGHRTQGGPFLLLPAAGGPVSLACGPVTQPLTSLCPPSEEHLPLDQGHRSPGGSHLEMTSAETRFARRSHSRLGEDVHEPL